MSSNTSEPSVVRISQKGQATIPKPLREKFDIETPGEVFIYEAGGRIVIEPVPDLEALHGIHAGDHDRGEILSKVAAEKDAARQRDEDRMDDLRPSEK